MTKHLTKHPIEDKIKKLRQRLMEFPQVLIAFSGGKDSFFLLKYSLETLGKKNVMAIFVNNRFITPNDRKRVNYFQELLEVEITTLDIDLPGDPKIMKNPKDRCYHCKKKIFSLLKERAAAWTIPVIMDGTTFSDLNEYRPGLRAIEELHVVSPLMEAGISSAEIVAHLQQTMTIPEFFLTSSTCLATRFPYDIDLDETLLDIFGEIEGFLVDQGIYPVKVRYIPDGIRVETPVERFHYILENRGKLLNLCRGKKIKFVTLDLEGIKSGVWD